MNPMFYFLVALTAVLAATANALRPVLDVNGDPIFRGSYYVRPIFSGGGLTLAPRGDKQCPLYVGQAHSEADMGIPVKFSNWRPRVPFVPESVNLNINMDVAATICVQSAYWSVVSESAIMTMLIAAGPKPEQDSLDSFFQIKKNRDGLDSYKISFCPNNYGCVDVGLFVDYDGVQRLTLGSTLPVVFVKANVTETSSKTMSII